MGLDGRGNEVVDTLLLESQGGVHAKNGTLHL
jgi:hypothetical protein